MTSSTKILIVRLLFRRVKIETYESFRGTIQASCIKVRGKGVSGVLGYEVDKEVRMVIRFLYKYVSISPSWENLGHHSFFISVIFSKI